MCLVSLGNRTLPPASATGPARAGNHTARVFLQQSLVPGDLTVRIHVTDPIDRGEECRFLHEGEVWACTASALLDMMANPKRVFPQV